MPSYWPDRPQQRAWLTQFCKGSGLDVGCGYKKIVSEAIGLDRMLGDPLCTADVVGDGCRLPFCDESMDYLVACHVLEHFSDPVAVLLEFRRVLRPGGALALAVPDAKREPRTLQDPLHLFGFSELSLQRMVSACGFEFQEFCRFHEGGWPCLTLSALKV